MPSSVMKRMLRTLLGEGGPPTEEAVPEAVQARLRTLVAAGSRTIYPQVEPPLVDIVRAAWAVGRTINVSDIGYGPTHWESERGTHDSPFPYYRFLAGFVRTRNVRRILEVGTHHGGSIQAMLRGMDGDSGACAVTVDISDINPKLRDIPGLRKLTGDANSESIIHQVVDAFAAEPIDLLYIDAAHYFVPTLTSLGVYNTLLRPRFIILDDIVLNESMSRLWSIIRLSFGGEAINCSDVDTAIRHSVCGFGVLRIR